MNIEKIKAAALAATTGPWVFDETEIPAENIRHPEGFLVAKVAKYRTDGRYIATANPSVVLELITRLESAEKELERERMRLAACGTAALGYFEGCHDEYKSASLDDVLRMRERLEAAERDAERYRFIDDTVGYAACAYIKGIGWSPSNTYEIDEAMKEKP